MFHKIQKFFLELQGKDEPTKKQWLIIFTSGTMIIVIGFWALYLNMTIQNFNEPKQVQKTSFPEIFKNGLHIISKEIKSFVGRTNSIIIQGANVNFVVKKDLEEIKPKKLP